MAVSHTLRNPSYIVRVACLVFCVHLTLWFIGCAGAPPRPEEDQLAALQVRRYPAAMKTVFSAAVDAAQDLEFTVDAANTDAGVLTATAQTDRELARITRADDHGLPTWAWVALIATGVIIIVAAIVILSSNDDDDKSRSGDEGTKEKRREGDKEGRELSTKTSQGGKVTLPGDESGRKDTVRVKYKEKPSAEREHRHRDRTGGGQYYYDEPDADFIIIGEDSPHAREWHQYRLTLHFDNPEPAETIVRLSVQGVRLEGPEVKEAGPVYDAVFYQRFFATLENSLRQMPADSTAK